MPLYLTLGGDLTGTSNNWGRLVGRWLRCVAAFLDDVRNGLEVCHLGAKRPQADEGQLQVLDPEWDADDGEEQHDRCRDLCQEHYQADRQPKDVPQTLRACAGWFGSFNRLPKGKENEACNLRYKEGWGEMSCIQC